MPSQYIIIIGCGRLGSTIANKLSTTGHSIVMIDHNEAAFDLLEIDFSGFKIQGDANEFFVLQQAKVEKADIVLALTDDDNLNIMLAQICQNLYQVSQVIARINKPSRHRMLEDLGIKTICPVLLTQDHLLNLIDLQD